MKKLWFLLLFLPIFSCTDESNEPEVPVCIDAILDDFKIDACNGGDLTTLNFRGQLVYCFYWGECQPEKTIEIYSEECTLICELGGPNALTICDGSSWADNTTFIDVIFRK